MRFRFWLVTCLVSLWAGAVSAQTNDREITLVGGDLYSVREGTRYTVFLVTSEGIVLVDPLSTETALWLKNELAARYPALRVRYVLHTHHHFDRAEGAAVFNDTAELVGHRNFADALVAARTTPPVDMQAFDPALLAAKDRNGDGEATPDEIYLRVRPNETAFGNRRSLVVGGKTIQLVHVYSKHAPDMAIVGFESERVVFAADHPPLTDADTASSATAREMVEWTKAVAGLQFDLLFSGSGIRFPADAVRTLRDYSRTLVETVATGYENGLSVAALQGTAALDRFRGLPQYDARQQQIAEVYRTIKMLTAEIVGVGGMKYAVRDSTYCRSFETCSTGGGLAIGITGLTISAGSLGGALEMTLGEQMWSSRTSDTYDDEMASRESRVSVLFRIKSAPGGVGWAIVAGPSFTVVDRAGISRTKRDFAPRAGRQPIADRQHTVGITGGVDLLTGIARGVDIVFPLRVTQRIGGTDPSSDLPTRLDLQAGVGLSVRWLRRVH